MKKLLLFVVALLGSVTMSNAQDFSDISIVGDAAKGWPNGADTSNDVLLATTDGITYTLESYTLTAGSLKFRQNTSWDAPNLNWGGDYATGVVSNNDIAIPSDGEYDIIFTLDATDPAGSSSFVITSKKSIVQVMGAAVGLSGYALSSDDGNVYTGAVHLADGIFNFSIDGAVQGGDAFPEGTSKDGLAAINASAGKYNVSFNKSTGAYVFTAGAEIANRSIGIIGSASGGWEDGDDVVMATTDGVTYTATGVELLVGELKFRQDGAWATQWGLNEVSWTDVNTYAGTVATNDVVFNISRASTYDVTLNIFTGAVSFVDTLELSVGGFDGVAQDTVTYSNGAEGLVVLSEVADVALYNFAGQLVVSESEVSSVDVAGLVSGVYVIVINGEQSGKVVIE